MNFQTEEYNTKVLELGEINPEKLLIFGGVYSNLQALSRIKEIAKENSIQPKQIICTGDIAAYCAHPEECVQMIKDWGIYTIKGNVEIQLINGEDDCGCNFGEGSRCDRFSQLWYPYVKQNISDDSISWMKELPDQLSFTLKSKKVRVVHGSPSEVAEYIFQSTPWKVKEQHFNQTASDVIIGGHCGLPFSDRKRNKIWLNAGVIGMPANDGTTRSWYLLLNNDVNNVRYELHSFMYDHKKAYKNMKSKELMREYSESLLTGLWDNCEILPDQETQNRGEAIKPFAGHW